MVRDLSLGEDASQVRTGESPEVLVAIRNALRWLLRASGLNQIDASLRRHAARLLEAIRLVMGFAPS